MVVACMYSVYVCMCYVLGNVVLVYGTVGGLVSLIYILVCTVDQE